MNPYKAAIKVVQKLLTDDYMPVDSNDPVALAVRELVKAELQSTYDWISAEDNGLTDNMILYAHECAFEGGASGLPECDACTRPFDAYMLVVRRATGEIKEVRACKSHMLDPGPLLDW